MLHYIKDGDFPLDRKIVYEQNGYKVFYDSFQGIFIYVGSNTEAEVECWKEIE
jgi:hypothetical protein